MKFERHLDGFREYLRTHHFATRTVESYGANTKRFLAFLEHSYPSINSVEKVTKDTPSSTFNGTWQSTRASAWDG